ncbi:DUF4114 domain-containing protein, partial [Laspinema palackyanum]|uniref:DUF4114 domain-containing protein n=1 Tax=Laspinema palackyanum TaxID=3231601 RepID=UPI00345D1840|nr:DUF4114 domain-containing protein [Laspinema sp. D2c]
MFNLLFGSKKRSEATGFQPQSKRYQGPAMRLETMRTPSGIVLDDTESAEESEFEIEDVDSDWDVTAEDSEGAEEFSGDESDGDDVEVVGEGSTEPTFGDEELEELPFFDLEAEEAIADEPSGETEFDGVTDITKNSATSDEGVEDVEFIETEGESDESTGDETAIDPEENILNETAEEEVEAEEEFETAATDETEIGEEDLDPETNKIETSEEPENDELETVDSQTAETDAEDTEPENIAEEESESEVIAETENNSSNEEIEETDELPEETDTEESELVATANLSNLQPNFESGTFTVGETGEVEVDFLVDGGAYKGEVALVSLSGMEGLDPNSKEFIVESLSRAASNSELGYVVIKDTTEGARFTGRLGGHDFNSGEYQGVKTFMMRPGDEFFLMLVPNGTVQQALNNPHAGGALRPLFSLATANPDDAYHVGQISDITGDGSAFAWEDIRVDGGSDFDYNDIVLQFRGATGKAALMDDVVAEGKDWRGTELGQEVINYVTSQQPEEPVAEQPEIPEEPVAEQPEEPETPEQPEEPVAEQPEEPVAEQPEEPVAEQPEEPVAEQPEEPVAEQPEEPVAEQPEEPVAEQPEEPVAEQPEEPVAEQPEEPVAEQP